MANTVDKVLGVALAEEGYLEKSSTAYFSNPNVLYDKFKGAGYDNYTKYGYEMHKVYPSVMDFPAYWCDAFVDWCFYKAYGVATAKSLLGGNFDDYTVASAEKYKEKGGWHKFGERPEKGDQIFFKNDVRINHTGLVIDVDDSYVYTIEGNTSTSASLEGSVVANGGGVSRKKYNWKTNTRIAGYGRPKYDVVRVGWEKVGLLWRYTKENGELARNEWLLINHHWYLFKNDGWMATGWHKWNGKDVDVDGDWYYLNDDLGSSTEGACWHEKAGGTGALELWTI